MPRAKAGRTGETRRAGEKGAGARRDSPRRALLDATIGHLAEHGTDGLTLRGLAAALGTSHRMLIYHFGGKDQLLVEVALEMERRQRDAFADIGLAPGTDPRRAMRSMYRQLSDPTLTPYMRLFFDLYGRGLRGDPAAGSLLDGVVEQWLAPLTEFIAAQGVPAGKAADDARLALAVARGLALDVLTTGDRAAVDRAAERFFTLIEADWPPA
ncbi:TetR/AcrR family transcriptional regulator [Actinocatenispora rupis]